MELARAGRTDQDISLAERYTAGAEQGIGIHERYKRGTVLTQVLDKEKTD